MRRLLACLLAAGLIAGCGDDTQDVQPDAGGVPEASGDERLPAADVSEVSNALDRVRELCRGDGRPPGLESSVEQLIAVVQRSPDKLYQGGEVDRTQTTSDAATLAARGLADCGAPQLAERVRAAVEEGGGVELGTG